jgi:hypothetical protein
MNWSVFVRLNLNFFTFENLYKISQLKGKCGSRNKLLLNYAVNRLLSLTPWRPKEEQARMVQLPPSHVRGGAWYRVRIRLASQSITAEFRVN